MPWEKFKLPNYSEALQQSMNWDLQLFQFNSAQRSIESFYWDSPSCHLLSQAASSHPELTGVQRESRPDWRSCPNCWLRWRFWCSCWNPSRDWWLLNSNHLHPGRVPSPCMPTIGWRLKLNKIDCQEILTDYTTIFYSILWRQDAVISDIFHEINHHTSYWVFIKH